MNSDHDTTTSESDEALPPSLRSAIAKLAPPAATSPEAVERVMAAVKASAGLSLVDARKNRSPFARSAIFLLAGSMAAALVLVVRGASPVGQSTAPQVAAAVSPHLVHFQLTDTGLQHVAIVGDFNGWNPSATPMRRDPSTGEWVASISLAAGRYLYSFVADGKRWLPDPNAPLASADDFGQQNSVVVVSSQNGPGALP